MEKERKDIRELSSRYAKLQTLINYVNVDSLREQHKKQLKNKAVGIDGVTKEEYSKNLEENLQDFKT